MTKETLTSGSLSVVFANIGVAPPIILALIAYVGLRLKDVTLNPPSATG